MNRMIGLDKCKIIRKKCQSAFKKLLALFHEVIIVLMNQYSEKKIMYIDDTKYLF